MPFSSATEPSAPASTIAATAATADLLIVPRWLACVDDGPPWRCGAAVLVRQGRIHAVDTAGSLRERHPDAHVIERTDGLLFPGLVNAHTHAAMVLLRGIGNGLPLQRWLSECIWPAESALVSDAFVHDGTLLACHEMLLGGTTCVGDMYFYPDAAARAVDTLRMRGSIGLVVAEFPTPYGTGADDYLRAGLQTRDAWAGDPRIAFHLAPHSPYTVADDTWRRVARLSAELDLTVVTHLHETADEIARSMQRHGMRPLERLAGLGLLCPTFTAVHGVHLNESEIAALARADASLVHCPHSNLKLGSGLAPTGQMRSHGLRLALGTDGAASNDRLDTLGEARTAALLASGMAGDPTAWSPHAMLAAMTRDGARALGLQGAIGSIRPGWRADLVCADLGNPSYGPVADPIATLLHTAGRESVTDVWVDGSHVVSERQLSAPVSRAAVGSVLERMALWHNRLGEFIPERTV